MSAPRKRRLTVILDEAVLDLKAHNTLVFVRKVNGKPGNVALGVGHLGPDLGRPQLFHINIFEWEEKYRVFLSSLHDGLELFVLDPKLTLLTTLPPPEVSNVSPAEGSHNDQTENADSAIGLQKGESSAETNAVDISFGQVAIYKDNLLGEARKADTTYWTKDVQKTFAVQNSPQTFHLGVQQLTVKGIYTPIFVDPHSASLNGTTEVSLEDEYLLYWSSEDEVRMGKFVKVDESVSFKVVFEGGEYNKTVRFGYKEPDYPKDGDEQFYWYHIPDSSDGHEPSNKLPRE
ncbi:hypothetical protein TWF694_011451 [Orbilia ellipsospora]|uniref:Uncharacterized protein n=1 Tax=Orbilia ellipsospora TaxID=2528407 RepID=A0AAV9XBH7_9PEZI